MKVFDICINSYLIKGYRIKQNSKEEYMITIRCNKGCTYTIKESSLVFVREEEDTVSIRMEDGNTIMEDKDEAFQIYEE